MYILSKFILSLIKLITFRNHYIQNNKLDLQENAYKLGKNKFQKNEYQIMNAIT